MHLSLCFLEHFSRFISSDDRSVRPVPSDDRPVPSDPSDDQSVRSDPSGRSDPSDDRSDRSDPTIGLPDPIRLYDERLPSPSSTLHRTVGPGGSMRISLGRPPLYRGRMDASRSITSLPGTLPKGHIRFLHPSERSHPFLASFGDATVRWYPLDLTPFGRDTSSPVSYHSQPARVSNDRTTQLGQYSISSQSSVELSVSSPS
ncbi:hypothetical protein ISN44_As02g000030 [Arabidopsis suecica]|uniref:Uncharacterized protein n=1 Tax=Arabidopsis suecica TaxID=45249 RepID=A0A8T2G099_ARASU|nr:hypothetical protein ISN44_As02g000030 [Arabidopsis suecica]